VNQGHGEYFGDVSSVREASLSSSSGQQQQPPNNNNSPSQKTPLSPPHAISSLSGVILQPGGDGGYNNSSNSNNTMDNGNVQQRHSHHRHSYQQQQQSSSSLSTFSLNKGPNNSLAGSTGGASANSYSSPLHPPALERSLLRSQLAQPTGGGAQQHSRSTRRGSTGRGGTINNTANTANNMSNSLLDSPYHHVTYDPNKPVPPQAGADAILGRRKSSSSSTGGNSQRRAASSSSATTTTATSIDRREFATSEPIYRSDNRDNISMLSRSISQYERTSFRHNPLSAVDSSSFNDRSTNAGFARFNNNNYASSQFGTNDSLRRDLTSITMRERQNSVTQSSESQTTEGGGGNDPQYETNNYNDNKSTTSSLSSAAIPIPNSSSRNMFGKKIKKSHSRTDLVREMALDHGNIGRNRSSSRFSNDSLNQEGSTNDNSPRRNSSFLSLAGSERTKGEESYELDGSTKGIAASGPAAQIAESGGGGGLGTHNFAMEHVSGEKTSLQVSLQPRVGSNQQQSSIPQGESSTIGPSNLSKSLQQTPPFHLSPTIPQGTNNTSQRTLSFQTSALPENSVSARSNISHQLQQSPQITQVTSSTVGSTASATMSKFRDQALATMPPNRTQLLRSGMFPHHSEQEHLMRASSISRRYSNESQTTVEVTNITNPVIENSVAGGTRDMNSAFETNPGVAARHTSSNPDCTRCIQMESTVLSLQADVQYLRTLELQREFVCMECESSSGSVLKHRSRTKKSMSQPPSKRHPPSIPENPSDGKSESSTVSATSKTSSRLAPSSSKLKRHGGGSTGGTSRSSLRGTMTLAGSRTASVLGEASKRLADLSTRHKRQVKQSTHERAYWQNDMHLKLEKFAMMAKNLNEEAAKRSNEVKETQAALEKVTSERNALVSQVEMLKARVKLYEDESIDYEKMRKEWENVELQTLIDMERVRKDQDAIIRDLSLRLDLAIKTIESDRRQQQQQRRQIMFPGSKTNSRDNSPSSPRLKAEVFSESNKVEYLETIKLTSKEMARKYQLLLESSMTQSALREKELKDSVEALEQQLIEAKSNQILEKISRVGSNTSL